MSKRILAILASLLMVSAAYADYVNTRPVNPLGDNGVENNLQEVFDSITISGGIDAIADQTPFAIFTNEASGGAVASFVIELTGSSLTNTIGIYKYGSPSVKAQIFSGPNGNTGSHASQALVTFFANGDVRVINPDDGTIVTTVGFGSQFGFYIATGGQTAPGSVFFYSEDSLNPGGNPQVLTYQGDNSTVLQIPGLSQGAFSSHEWLIAFEDVAYAAGDADFQDAVILVESIRPVPAPGALLLGLFGLGGVAGLKRRFAR